MKKPEKSMKMCVVVQYKERIKNVIIDSKYEKFLTVPEVERLCREGDTVVGYFPLINDTDS